MLLYRRTFVPTLHSWYITRNIYRWLLYILSHFWNIDNFFPISIICNIYQSLQLTVVVKILSKIFFYLYRHEYTEKHIHFPVCYLCKRNKQFIWNSYMNITNNRYWKKIINVSMIRQRKQTGRKVWKYQNGVIRNGKLKDR
jgi:hypothetical protein